MKQLLIRNRHRIKRVFSDLSYRTLASLISTGTQQLVVLPLLASFFTAEVYGLILTIRGLYNTISLGFGNALKNVRQITSTQYNKERLVGDFNILIWIFAFISSILITVVCFVLGNVGSVDKLLLFVSIFISTLNAYYLVHYYLVIDFKNLLINSLIAAGGALIGILLVKYSRFWPLPLLFSGLFSLIDLFVRTPRIREPFKVTTLMPKTLSKVAVLILTTLIAQSLLYLDRLLLYPIIGGDAVATYSTAAFFGKSVAVVITPLASVLLGYYCQDNFKMSLKYFWGGNIIVLVLAALFMAASLLLAPWLTKLLFPSLIDTARPFIFIANLTAMIGISGNIAQSAVLKFANISWQIIIQLIYAIIYIVVGLLAMPKYGIWGFCYVALAANIIRLIVLYAVGHVSICSLNKKQ